ncbi:MAG: circularly permuted type 2 ATP-grasp protein, partial [Burkholderiaceae bacterium]
MSDSSLPQLPIHAIPDPVDLASDLALDADSGHLDELRDPDSDSLRPHWAQFFSHVGADGINELNRRAQSLARQLRDNGVTYNVYADAAHGAQRPWSLDLFPMVVTPACWAEIEAGVLQRTRLLNTMLTDLYGPQTLLQDGLLPPALVQGNPGYLRAMHGVSPIGGTWLHVAAFDLARGPDGHWRVVSQRTQAPSGLGYLLENRIAIARQFPKAFAGMKVQRLAASYQALLNGIKAIAPNGQQARVALLTPGPYNETYFEHAYLARYLGLTLVEGSDLTVRDQR